MDSEYYHITRNVMPPVRVVSPRTGTAFVVLGSDERRPRTLAFRTGHLDIYDRRGLLVTSIPDPDSDPVDLARLAAIYDASVRAHYPEEVEMRGTAPAGGASPPAWVPNGTATLGPYTGLSAAWTCHPDASGYRVEVLDRDSGEVVYSSDMGQSGVPRGRRFILAVPSHHLRRVPERASLVVRPLLLGAPMEGQSVRFEVAGSKVGDR